MLQAPDSRSAANILTFPPCGRDDADEGNGDDADEGDGDEGDDDGDTEAAMCSADDPSALRAVTLAPASANTLAAST